jgi:hypothetical protein
MRVKNDATSKRIIANYAILQMALYCKWRYIAMRYIANGAILQMALYCKCAILQIALYANDAILQRRYIANVSLFYKTHYFIKRAIL